jgi:hypothetical protein
MSTRSYKSVVKSFQDEVEKAFVFLSQEFGTGEPERDGKVLQTVTYRRTDLVYTVVLDHHEMGVHTEVSIVVDQTKLVGNLKQLVRAAGLGSPNEVPRITRTLHDLQGTLESQATFLRRLLPFISPSPSLPRMAVADLFRKANASEYRYGT